MRGEPARFADLYEFLQFICVNPAMLVRDLPLDELDLFCRGYCAAVQLHGIDEFGSGSHRQFSDWLEKRYGWSLAQGWANAITRHSRDAEAAWLRFFELLDLFCCGQA